MTRLTNIKRYYRVIDNSLFMAAGTLDYARVTDAIIKLSNTVHDYDGENDDMWYIGEFGSCCLDDFIVGAYWHFAEWHGGQWSKGYEALSALGQVFRPGMSGSESDNEAYLALATMASR